ncbi:MAG: 5-formyltetrahydrofolate cyclo-ligase [Lachnospiraceae bacterium]|nr:5-formyltetrahydrofolate cyclo-ligase [Lachnospiraceae bacterium]
MTGNRENKDRIRKRALSLRDSLDPLKRKAEEEYISNCISNDNRYVHSRDVLIYASFGSEVSTARLIDNALSEGRRVYLPRITDSSRSLMDLVRIRDRSELEKGHFGIPEPVGDELYRYEDAGAYMVLPGAAFDREGDRIGYGKGFYDIFLKDRPGIYKVGICFSCQFFENIPAEDYDIRMDRVICGSGSDL